MLNAKPDIDIWAPSCIIAAIFIFFYLPEVKGRTLEEIDEMFMARLPARKFRKYVCTGQAALESKARGTMESGDEKQSKDGAVETIERVYGDKKGVAGVVETAVNVA
jgi:MFS transporter, SP family, sugar:H+ symporter